MLFATQVVQNEQAVSVIATIVERIVCCIVSTADTTKASRHLTLVARINLSANKLHTMQKNSRQMDNLENLLGPMSPLNPNITVSGNSSLSFKGGQDAFTPDVTSTDTSRRALGELHVSKPSLEIERVTVLEFTLAGPATHAGQLCSYDTCTCR